MSKLIDITDSEQAELALEFAESIHAGFPSPAADHAGERINLAREMTPHPHPPLLSAKCCKTANSTSFVTAKCIMLLVQK